MENKHEEHVNQGETDLDPYIMMEEILEKLKLLDYEAFFTRVK